MFVSNPSVLRNTGAGNRWDISHQGMPAAPPRRRGVLALLTGDLPYHPYDAATVSAMRERGTRRNRRRSRRADDDAEGGQRTGSAPATVGGGEYDPSGCEFTLFYFADSACRNSLRFGPVLAEFVREANAAASAKAVRCICVPNDAGRDGASALCRGTGFLCLPFGHENRLAVVRLLSATRVPSVIVVDGKTGRKVTDLGMEGIEARPASEIIDAWRAGGSGLGLAAVGCAIC